MSKYTVEEEVYLNRELILLQNRARRLALNNNYNNLSFTEIQCCILKQLFNAEDHKDINSYIWNSGTIEKTLDYISENLKLYDKNNFKDV